MEVSPIPGQWGYVHGNATVTYANESSASGTEANVQYHWMHLLGLVFAPLGLIGNSLVLWLLGFRIQRNPFSVYILNLAAADFLFLACVLLVCIEAVVPYLNETLYSVIILVSVLSYCAGLSLLAAISTSRCLSALFPIWYRCRRPRSRSPVVCALLWALAGLPALLDSFACTPMLETHFCGSSHILQTTWLLLLTLVLCVSSLTLLLRVRCSSQRRQPPRLYGLVLLTVLVFLLCGLPAGFEFLVPSFPLFLQTPWLPPILACVNSSANPFIYFFLGSQRRRRGREPLRVVLQRALGVEEEEDHGKRDTPHTNTQETSS